MKWLLAMLRDSRGSRGQLSFFTACIAIGVAAVVGIAALASAIEQGLQKNSRDFLAADLVVSSRRPLDPSILSLVTASGASATTAVREFASMVARVDPDGTVGPARIAQLKTVRGHYPFYGVFELDPPGTLAAALARGVVVAPELGVAVGERLRIGKSLHDVTAIVRKDPQQIGFMAMMGSRVYVREAALAQSGLMESGSRVRYELLVRYPGPGLEALKATLLRETPGAEYLRIETWRDGQPRLREAIANVERYLGLVALLSLILGGIGIAQIVRAWIASRTPSIAILRCLGMRPREILVLFLGQVLIMALLGSGLGAAVGGVLPIVFARLGPTLVATDVVTASFFQPLAIGQGFGLGLVVAILFSLPPLTAVWRVSPAKVLRADAEPLPPPWLVQWLSSAVLLFGGLAVAWLQSGDFLVALWFTLGFLGLIVVLALGARVMMTLASRLPRARLHPYLAQGISALARPGAGTTGAVVALGLGVTVVASMVIVEREMSANIESLIPVDAPTVFLVDVQPDQWPSVRETLAEQQATAIESQSVTMARLRAINGRSVREIAKERRGRARRILTREQRLAPLATLPENTAVVEGRFWQDPAVDEISLERGYAKDLGVTLGDVLTMDVQGVPVEFELTSLRTVDWRSFSLNFYVIVEPAALQGAPSFRLAAARVPLANEQPLQDQLAGRFPNVSVIQARALIDQATEFMQQVSIGVRVLGGFTVLSGLAILAGAIAASSLRRRREAALLKTLGATRRGVAVLNLVEYGLLGAVAGLLGAIGAILLAWGFLVGFADLPFRWPLWMLPAATLSAAVLAATCGILASRRALRAPARESLEV